jgi:hypothetical protein
VFALDSLVNLFSSPTETAVQCWYHRVIMYYTETKAISCHTQFDQFLGSHQTLGGGGGRYFCGFYLAVFNAVLIARTNINKYKIIQSLHFYMKQICRNEFILIPS